MIIGALEMGGTKMVCAVGDENGNIYDKITVPTTNPKETFKEVIGYFTGKGICALGIGSFGPIDTNKGSKTYGYITSTPKEGWTDCNVVGTFMEALNVPIGFDTDVNAALLGEVYYGGAIGLQNVAYYTIGTGIGAGIMCGGRLLCGVSHTEAGHVLVRRYPGDTYAGKCPFHKDCFEGMASGPAIHERWGAPADELSDRNEVWETEAFYIAQCLVNLILIASPQRIILGGGVMHQMQLFPLIRQQVKEMMTGYVKYKESDDIDTFIVPSQLNDEQGIKGALRLALDAL